MKKIWTVVSALVCASGAANAHQLWLEQAEGEATAVIRFGEFGDNLREASPGLLDKFVQPAGTLVSAQGEKAAEGRKSANGFVLPFKAAQGDSIVAEEARYPLYTGKQGDKEVRNWYRPAARLVTALTAQQPRLTLDLVPSGKPGEFKVVFKGQPLPKAKVNLVVQSGWAKEAHADAQGLVQFDMPWQGTYVAEVAHNDRSGGERPGAAGAEKYDAVHYVTSLTYVKADGVAAIPAGPAATPNK